MPLRWTDARSTFRALFGDVRVDRTGTGYADLRLDALLPTKLVAGVGFEPTTFGL